MKHLTRLASATALAAALATAACSRNPDATDGNAQAQMALPALPATLPLEAGAATEIARAPSASDLPDAKPLRLARVADRTQAYGYADAAYSYDEALGDAPPDYGFDYDGADPWAWQGFDDSLMVAEPIDDGYRYYYYRPGADEPYFVRDPFYSYGYSDGLLAVVYGADGGVVPYADYGPRLIYASRYYARGRRLWGASRRTQRRPVIAADWVRRRPVIFASRDRWGAGRARQPEWRRYADAEGARQTAYWGAEQLRRQADAHRFDGWRQGGFRSAPPPRAIPVAWEKAKWAQDDRRYRPAAEARRDDRPPADRREVRQDRPDDRQQRAQRDQLQAERAQAQAARQRRGDQPNRDRLVEQAQADRHGTDQPQQRDIRGARQEAERARRQQADAGRRQAPREGQQARREAAQPQQRETRQPQAAEHRPEPPRQQRAAAQVERRQAQQSQRAQAQQAAVPQPREAQPAERRQAQAAQRQAGPAQRRQADQTPQRQALQPQRQAERQQAAPAERQQAAQAQRQQAQQAQRQERRDARGPNPR